MRGGPLAQRAHTTAPHQATLPCGDRQPPSKRAPHTRLAACTTHETRWPLPHTMVNTHVTRNTLMLTTCVLGGSEHQHPPCNRAVPTWLRGKHTTGSAHANTPLATIWDTCGKRMYVRDWSQTVGSPLALRVSLDAPLAATPTAAASGGTPNYPVLRASACSTRRAPRPAPCGAGCQAWRQGDNTRAKFSSAVSAGAC